MSFPARRRARLAALVAALLVLGPPASARAQSNGVGPFYTQASTKYTNGSPASIGVTSSCPAGYVVTGGGYDDDGGEFGVYASFPTGSGSWSVSGTSLDEQAGHRLTAYSICLLASAVPGYEIVQKTASFFTTRGATATASCGPGRRAISGGYDAGGIDVEQGRSWLDADGTGWDFAGRVQDPEDIDEFDITSYAICGDVSGVAGAMSGQSLQRNVHSDVRYTLNCSPGLLLGAGWDTSDPGNVSVDFLAPQSAVSLTGEAWNSALRTHNVTLLAMCTESLGLAPGAAPRSPALRLERVAPPPALQPLAPPASPTPSAPQPITVEVRASVLAPARGSVAVSLRPLATPVGAQASARRGRAARAQVVRARKVSVRTRGGRRHVTFRARLPHAGRWRLRVAHAGQDGWRSSRVARTIKVGRR